MFEDDRMFRESLKAYWHSSDDIFVVAEFENADRAISKIRKYQPDVILMDIEMPGISGLNALAKIIEQDPEAKVLIVTQFLNDDKIFAAICNGAKGYVLKSDVEKIEEAIKNVYMGGGHMTPSIALRVMELFQSSMEKEQVEDANLTQREMDVLGCMVEGKNYKMIADYLNIAYTTVNSHVKNIYKKLHVHSAPEAVREAIRRRLV